MKHVSLWSIKFSCNNHFCLMPSFWLQSYQPLFIPTLFLKWRSENMCCTEQDECTQGFWPRAQGLWWAAHWGLDWHFQPGPNHLHRAGGQNTPLHRALMPSALLHSPPPSQSASRGWSWLTSKPVCPPTLDPLQFPPTWKCRSQTVQFSIRHRHPLQTHHQTQWPGHCRPLQLDTGLTKQTPVC